MAVAALLAVMLAGGGCGKKPAATKTGAAKTLAAKPAATNAVAAANAAAGAVTNAADPYTSIFEDLPFGQCKDPFYPDSVRRQAKAEAHEDQPSAPPVAVLVLKAIVHGRTNSQAVINDQTFAVGETNEVVVPNGKVEVHCLEISTNSVRVQVTGQGEMVLSIEEKK